MTTARWVAINTHPHKERLASLNLERQDFEIYCPMLMRRIRHARRVAEVRRPMFPGYVFTKVDQDLQRWRPLLSTYGVRSVISTASGLSYLPENFVEALRQREVDGVVSRPTSPFQIGQEVRLTGVAFDGLIAEIIDMDDKGRLTVLLNILNRPVNVKVPTTAVSEILEPNR